MKTMLSPSWELSTDHAASSYGQPVPVHRATGEAYGAGDVVRLYLSHGFTLAADGVRRLAKTAKLDADGLALVERFAGLRPGH